MTSMGRMWGGLWSDESGQDATEYALLIVLLALVVAGGMTLLATGLNNSMSNAASTLTAQSSGS